MRMQLIGGALAAGLITLAGVANAAPIAANSTLSLNGQNNFTQTSIDFTSNGNIGNNTGSFTGLGTCTNCVTLTDFNNATPTPFQLYSVTNNGLTTTLTLASDTFTFDAATNNLTITGSGTATLTGFDATPGTITITTQGVPGGTGGTSVTFSSTTTASAVPEPASLALLGSALAGLGFFGRRRRKTA